MTGSFGLSCMESQSASQRAAGQGADKDGQQILCALVAAMGRARFNLLVQLCTSRCSTSRLAKAFPSCTDWPVPATMIADAAPWMNSWSGLLHCDNALLRRSQARQESSYWNASCPQFRTDQRFKTHSSVSTSRHFVNVGCKVSSPFPCSRLALGATDFVKAKSGSSLPCVAVPPRSQVDSQGLQPHWLAFQVILVHADHSRGHELPPSSTPKLAGTKKVLRPGCKELS